MALAPLPEHNDVTFSKRAGRTYGVAPMRVLVFRLSSLGDVVLCASVLESLDPAIQVEWVVKKSFEPLLRAHPRISKLHVYDPEKQSWKSFLNDIGLHRFDQFWDLHRNLRTFLARWFFSQSPLRWKCLPKQRVRRLGFFIFKGLWPKGLRPQHLRTLAQNTVGQSSRSLPANLRHLQNSQVTLSLALQDILQRNPTIGVMPSSAWAGKAWPIQHFADLIRNLSELGHKVVVLGQKSDSNSVSLVAACAQQKIDCVDGVGRLDLAETATLFGKLQWLVANDTGLSHLAESVGLRTLVLFGPTHPDLGFGPSLLQSRSASSSPWCQPCSKDGRWCFRSEPYVCLKELTPSSVLEKLRNS